MDHYLVIAHQTAVSPELVDLLKAKLAANRDSTFTLVVPATPINHLLVWEEGETQEVATRRATDSQDVLRREGIPLERAKVGPASPIEAVDDELRRNPATYKEVIVSTFPVGLSHWLRLGVVDRIRRMTTVPVLHVVARPEHDGEPAEGAGTDAVGSGEPRRR
jgi:hypothetical protein